MMLSLDTAYRSFGGEVEASGTPTICRLPDSRRHQLSAIAHASSVPILNLALSSKKLPQDKLFDLGQNFIRPQLATVNGAALPSPYGGKILQAQVDLDQRAMQSHNVSAEDVVNAISAQNLVLPAGTEKIGKFEWNVNLNASPTLLDHINDLPVKKVDGTVIHVPARSLRIDVNKRPRLTPPPLGR